MPMSSPSTAPLPAPAQGRDALSVLRSVFGLPGFRGAQGEIIRHVTDGGNCLVLMPTGGGKSLCYQLPALLRDGCGVVVSPLIALMRDQVAAMLEAGVNAAALNSSLTPQEASDIERRLIVGDLDLLYVAPERLLTPRCLALLARAKVALFAIDEAHCVSQWGHDFRPEYVGLSIIAERFPDVPRIALTATADELTRKEIVERLQLADSPHFVSSFDRPNIRYEIVDKRNAVSQLKDFIRERHAGDAGVVYCLSRKRVEEVAAALDDAGIAALPYHAGLDSSVRSRNQDRFLNEDGIVIVATIAFGMGIDKPDVRFVAHLDLPTSIDGHSHHPARPPTPLDPRTAQHQRVLLPGDRTRGPRRQAVGGLDGLRSVGHRAAAPHDRRVERLRGIQAGLDRQARCARWPCRNAALPASAAARLFRRDRDERGLRQLRQLPDAAENARRQGAGAKASVLRLPHRAALRRDAPHRRADRTPDREGDAVRPRQADGVRHRTRAQREAVAHGAAAACGDGTSAE